MRFTIPDLNPVPWTSARTTRQGSFKTGDLDAYQRALKEELKDLMEGQPLMSGELDLRMWFWRALEENIRGEGRNTRAHQADASNMFKSTEDAMQKIVFDNDRAVRRTMSEIVDQGPEVRPCVIIEVYPYLPALGVAARP